jgi:enamine deaminase RidA (YjgF/YER057c/UK114 family)
VSSSTRRISGGSIFEDTAGYCRAIRLDGWIAVSGSVAPTAAGERLADLDGYTQTRRAFEAALGFAGRLGASADSVLRTRMFLAPDAEWQECARAHGELFGGHRPANTTVYAGRLIPDGALVEVELDARVAQER